MTDSDKLFLEAEMLLDECIELRKNGSNSDQGKADRLMADAMEAKENLSERKPMSNPKTRRTANMFVNVSDDRRMPPKGDL